MPIVSDMTLDHHDREGLALFLNDSTFELHGSSFPLGLEHDALASIRYMTGFGNGVNANIRYVNHTNICLCD